MDKNMKIWMLPATKQALASEQELVGSPGQQVLVNGNMVRPE